MWPYKKKQELDERYGKFVETMTAGTSFLTFDSKSETAPGTVIQMFLRPQVVFRPDYLVVDDEIVRRSFDVVDLRVGKSSYLITTDNLRLSHLLYPRSRLRIPTVQVGQDFGLMVVNVGDKPCRFIGTFEGIAVW